MDCICSMLASIANSVMQAVTAADAHPITTDMGNPGISDGFSAFREHGLPSMQTGTGQSSTLATTHVAALFILVLVALFRVLTTQGKNL